MSNIVWIVIILMMCISFLSNISYAFDLSTIRIKKNYDCIYPPSEGLFRVKYRDKEGFINKFGDEVVEPKYDCVDDFSEGLARVKIDSKWGFINTSGNEVIELKYDLVEPFSEGLAPVRIDGFAGFINKHGEEVVRLEYDWVNRFENGLAVVNINGKEGLINKDGLTVLPVKYDEIRELKDGVYTVVIDRKIGYIDVSGLSITDVIHKNGGGVSEGLILIRLDDYKWEYLDKRGNKVIDMEYSWVEPFKEGLSLVFDNRKVKFINKSGNIVISTNYIESESFNDGLALVGDGYKKGFINTEGKEIIPLIYDWASSFNDGMAPVGIRSVESELGLESDLESDLKIGLVDKTGNIIVPLKYKSIDNKNGFIVAERFDGQWDLINYTSRMVAMPTKSKILLNGVEKQFNAYLIEDNNYIKIRDLAFSVSGTNKKFDVVWDDTNKSIRLISNKEYTCIGEEMNAGDGKIKSPIPNKHKIYKDNEEVDIKAYNIEGNNNFNLRDIAGLVGLEVIWDGIRNIISINT